MSTTLTVVSAPGKVLLAGGYLVLDRQYSGLVVATSSRFYSTVRPLPPASNSSGSSSSATISVRAGQFPSDSSTWTYTLSYRHENGVSSLDLVQSNEALVGKNKFIAIALLKTLELAVEKIAEDAGSTSNESAKTLISRLRGDGRGVEVVVLADNDFYSQREQLTARSLPPRISSLTSLTPFNPLPRPIGQTNKTGLGSSAALVTSLIASLLAHLQIIILPEAPSKRTSSGPAPPSPLPALDLVHSLAQLAHCAAQGKVGSGFDVSSAVYGTHIYRRFSPSVLAPLMELASPTTISLSSTPTLLPALNPGKWDQNTTPFRLPKGLRLVLADVDAGTDTPSFVGKVLEWRKRDTSQATDLWGSLDRANMQLEKLLGELVEREGDGDYHKILHALAGQTTIEAESQTGLLIAQVGVALSTIREHLRRMSELSGVPIEPPEQTRLVDASSALAGVIGGGVPGAGGYDALFLLIIDEPSVIERVEGLWEGWTELSVSPLLARQSDGGLRLERVEEVKGLQEALERA